MYNTLTRSGDALVVELPKHKGDQEGDTKYPRHVYANPLDPLICPVLNLGLNIIYIPKLDHGNNYMLGGNSVKIISLNDW